MFYGLQRNQPTPSNGTKGVISSVSVYPPQNNLAPFLRLHYKQPGVITVVLNVFFEVLLLMVSEIRSTWDA